MALLGARGTTYEEMRCSLALPAQLERLQLIEAFRTVQKTIDVGGGNKKPQLLTASKLFVQNDLSINSNYNATLYGAFSSDLERVDFTTSPDAVGMHINAFVEKATKNLIKDLIPPLVLSTLTRFVLISAVYMKAKWEQQFRTTSTNLNGEIYVAHEKRMRNDVPVMMSTQNRFAYAENEVAHFIWLPYAAGKVQMVTAVPEARDGGVNDFQTAVSEAGGLHEMLRSLQAQHDMKVF